MRTNAPETSDPLARFAAPLLILAASIAMPPCAAARETVLESTWRAATSPGDATRPAPMPLEKGRVSVGVSNDDRFIYLTLTTTDRALFYSMYRSGMTLWIDPKGGRREAVGIRYPIGIDGDPVSEKRGRSGGDRQPGSAVPPDQWLELVGNVDDAPRRVAIGDIPGLDVRLVERDETFIYEAKLPLVTSDDRSLVVGASAGGTIGVAWKTDRPKPEAFGPPRGMGGGSHSGMGGGAHGGAGGRVPRENRSGSAGDDGPNVRPLHVWARVKLAASEAPAGDAPRGE